jgi:hypothetical protein
MASLPLSSCWAGPSPPPSLLLFERCSVRGHSLFGIPYCKDRALARWCGGFATQRNAGTSTGRSEVPAAHLATSVRSMTKSAYHKPLAS